MSKKVFPPFFSLLTNELIFLFGSKKKIKCCKKFLFGSEKDIKRRKKVKMEKVRMKPRAVKVLLGSRKNSLYHKKLKMKR